MLLEYQAFISVFPAWFHCSTARGRGRVICKTHIQITVNYRPWWGNRLLEQNIHILKENLQGGHTLISHWRGSTLLPYNTGLSQNSIILVSLQDFSDTALMANWQKFPTSDLLHFLHLSQYCKHLCITHFHRILEFKACVNYKLQLKNTLHLVISGLGLLSQFKWFSQLHSFSFDYLGQGWVWIAQGYLGAAMINGTPFC